MRRLHTVRCERCGAPFVTRYGRYCGPQCFPRPPLPVYVPYPPVEGAVRVIAERFPTGRGGTPPPDALSAAYLAELAGVSRRTVVRWRSGGRIRLEHVEALAYALNVDPYRLSPDYYTAAAG